MMSGWREYQIQAASFFVKLGFTTRIECEIFGVRGRHKIDVYVEGDLLGIPIKWAVECKAWKTNVPKEKVAAFAFIIQDAGIERGFLLSEKGFQAGAVLAARKTNIELTSISDLEAVTRESVFEARLSSLSWRIQKARERLRIIKNELFDGELFPMVSEMGSLFCLEQVLQDAGAGKFPLRYSPQRHFEDFESFYKFAEETIAIAERWKP